MHKKIIALGLVITCFMTFATQPLKANANTVSSEYSTQMITDVENSFDAILANGEKINEKEVLIEADNYNAIINSETGDITHNFYDESGTLANSYKTNFSENLKGVSIEEIEIQTRQTLATNVMPLKLNSLYYTIAKYSSSTNSVYAQNSSNARKSYNVNGSYTNSAKTMNFVRAMDKAASNARLLINTGGASAVIALVGFFGIGGKLTSAAMIAALKALGYTSLVGGAAALVVLYNNFQDATISANHAYNGL